MPQIIDGFEQALGTVAASDGLTVAERSVVISTGGGTAIIGTGSSHLVRVFGAVASYGGTAVALGDDGLDQSHRLMVADGGSLTGTTGASIFGGMSEVTVRGTISAFTTGIVFQALPGGGMTLVNEGVIRGGVCGIKIDSAATMTVENRGLIAGVEFAYLGNDGNEFLLNRGRMPGDVQL
jgi:hypothetical protein